MENIEGKGEIGSKEAQQIARTMKCEDEEDEGVQVTTDMEAGGSYSQATSDLEDEGTEGEQQGKKGQYSEEKEEILGVNRATS